MNPLQQSARSLSEISEELVIEYLCSYPEFFQKHEDLLQKLDLPHSCGVAHSLIERQVEQLRQKNRRLDFEKSAALAKEAINSKKLLDTKALTLELLAAKSIAPLFLSIQAYLKKNLKINYISLGVNQELHHLVAEINKLEAAKIQIICLEADGALTQSYIHEMTSLYPGLKALLALPLKYQQVELGVLWLGGEHQRQFEVGGDKHTLQYIAGILSVCLNQLA